MRFQQIAVAVSVIDVELFKVIKSIPVGEQPLGVVVYE